LFAQDLIMDASRYKAIAFSRAGRILTITLNRPEALNAVDAVLHEELARVFTDAAADAESDVIILTGAGTAFSAGGDIQWMQRAIENPHAFATATVDEARRIIFSILDCDKPIICRLNGDAIGLGATIALFCDVIVANDKARIADPHVRVGLVAGDGGAAIWPQLIGFARAKEYLMTGDMISAPDAACMGLINHAVTAAELDDKVGQLVNKLAKGATLAIRWTKRSVNLQLRDVVTRVFDASIAYEVMSQRTADHKEAVSAFNEKRRPQFKGS
jgi:enoyl-CoA hydratase